MKELSSTVKIHNLKNRIINKVKILLQCKNKDYLGKIICQSTIKQY